MIYTITLNPSIDYIIYLDEFKYGQINYPFKSTTLAGGKGINVSTVLSNLDLPSVCLGFVGGYRGKSIQERLNASNIKNDFIVLKDENTRINIKLMAQKETQINESGPFVKESYQTELLDKLDQIQSGDIVVLSGSVPNNVDDKIYMRIMQRLENRDVKVIVDARNGLLLNSLKYQPFLIKPNRNELAELFKEENVDNLDLKDLMIKLQNKGAKNIIVSLDSEGAIMLDEHQSFYRLKAPNGEVTNSVGAGDSLIAGFISGYLESNGNYYQAFKKGIAAGSASAFSEFLATKEEIDKILKEMKDD